MQSKSLNPCQQAIVEHTEGAVMVSAGAGSGKTRVLTERIARIVEGGTPPSAILAITFTNKAAGEMRERLSGKIGEGAWISTFHAMCVRILRYDIEALGYSKHFTIYSETEKERLMKRLAAEMSSDNDKLVKSALRAVGDMKNSNMTLDQYRQANRYSRGIGEIVDLIERYEQEMQRCSALDFDDLLIKVLTLFKERPDILAKYQSRFKYIMVDEFQDTNEVQYEIVRLLAQGHGNIFVVGDEDQSIYGWRGANFRNLLKLTEDFDCTVYKLEQNYRSTKRILSAANQVISHNKNRFDKTLFSDGGEGAPVEYFAGLDEGAEAEYVAGQISFLRSLGYSYNDFAVLIRLNALSRSFEEKFLRYNIPHRVFGGIKFYERKEIKDILAYIRLTVNPRDKDAILRVINYPKRGIGNAIIGQLNNYCLLEDRHLGEAVRDIASNQDLPLSLIKKVEPFANIMQDLTYFSDKKGLYDFVLYLIERSGIMASLNDDTEENINRRMNVDDFLASVEEHQRANPKDTISDFLSSVLLYTDMDEVSEGEAVTIATMHSAKGLEYKVVFVAGLEEGVMPIMRAGSEEDIEEERRLMYVAVTRAKERLYLTRAQSRFLYGERKYTTESRFLNESDSARREREQARLRERYAKNDRYSDPVGGYKSYASASRSAPIAQTDISKFEVGKKVQHAKFGIGKIVNLVEAGNNTYVSVDFDGFGVKNLVLSFAPLEVLD